MMVMNMLLNQLNLSLIIKIFQLQLQIQNFLIPLPNLNRIRSILILQLNNTLLQLDNIFRHHLNLVLNNLLLNLVLLSRLARADNPAFHSFLFFHCGVRRLIGVFFGYGG